MADDRRDDRSGPGEEGFLESLLRDATITGTEEDPPPPPAEPQVAAPETTNDPDDDTDSS
ncbi:hypothetical protein [Pseudonocardia sp.]|jgi:hypothetical protein|uniref:hypothetical protein n=1 Tax=Pseudonocardia sp. TaxID=60912 RepID=UPI002DA7249F|nr:hypothetical protein [Pseudonocardia sp.]